jgi:hydrogenase expression/formation protein HypD
MKYIDEFRNIDHITKLVNLIRRSIQRNYTFMEVCGGHTAAIQRFGLPYLLPENIKLLSGPGCPVCVTGIDYIDKAVVYSRMKDVIIATYGDLLRVPGSASSLEKEKASGADIKIVFSGLEALQIARDNPGKKVIFLGIGFETTAPGTAVTLMEAESAHIENLLVFSAHKVMPPAIEIIIKDGSVLDGFICPGHVSTITGSSIFRFIPEKYNLGCVIAGFEPFDILMSILMLIRQANSMVHKVEIQYTRAVKVDGNAIARRNMYSVLETCDATWRGFGNIPMSGLRLRSEYEKFNAELRIPVKISLHEDNDLCICGKILRGLVSPPDCPLFSDLCNPENPLGACMVSNEGTCNSWHKYRKIK